MLWSREHLQKFLEHPAKAVLSLGRCQLHQLRLLTQDQPQLGHHLHQHLAVDTHSGKEFFPPIPELLLGLHQNLLGQLPKSADKRRVGSIPTQLVVFAG